MKPTEYIDVLIIGAGPAGMSTALHLVQIDPTWADRIMVVDKATHPREKLCGGGITRLGAEALAKLRLSFEVPHVAVREIRLVYQDLIYAFRDDPAFRVVRRDEFDHWLVQCAVRQGVIVRQGETVQAITPQANYVEVATERATIRAKVVVAADGSRSFVRQKLKWDDGQRMARLLEVLTPEVAEQQPEFREGVAVFDFSHLTGGLQGYYWDFPSLIKGQPFMNRGVFDSRVQPQRSRASLKQILQTCLVQRKHNLADYQLKGHPIYWFKQQGRFAIPRLLLVGDAAGVDPLLGEGISFALAYGDVAAGAIGDAFARQDLSFSTYKSNILSHPILSQLALRARFAPLVYAFQSPWLIRLGWRLFPLLMRGLAWYKREAVLVDSPYPIRLDSSMTRES